MMARGRSGGSPMARRWPPEQRNYRLLGAIPGKPPKGCAAPKGSLAACVARREAVARRAVLRRWTARSARNCFLLSPLRDFDFALIGDARISILTAGPPSVASLVEIASVTGGSVR